MMIFGWTGVSSPSHVYGKLLSSSIYYVVRRTVNNAHGHAMAKHKADSLEVQRLHIFSKPPPLLTLPMPVFFPQLTLLYIYSTRPKKINESTVTVWYYRCRVTILITVPQSTSKVLNSTLKVPQRYFEGTLAVLPRYPTVFSKSPTVLRKCCGSDVLHVYALASVAVYTSRESTYVHVHDVRTVYLRCTSS